MAKPSKRSALGVLTRATLLDLADAFELEIPRAAAKAELIDALAASKRAAFAKILDALKRDDLKEICRAHGLDDSGREKAPIRDRILAGGAPDDDAPFGAGLRASKPKKPKSPKPPPTPKAPSSKARPCPSPRSSSPPPSWPQPSPPKIPKPAPLLLRMATRQQRPQQPSSRPP